jgi:hypothetical protein
VGTVGKSVSYKGVGGGGGNSGPELFQQLPLLPLLACGLHLVTTVQLVALPGRVLVHVVALFRSFFLRGRFPTG